MARIRTVKPEFWANEQVMDCSPMARLLFIGLWNFCDDGGNHPASSKTIKAEIFPGDDITSTSVQELLDELASNSLIALYTAQDKAFWHVTGWHHQKIDKPTLKYPVFPDEIPAQARLALGESSPPEGKGKGRVREVKTLSGEPDAIEILNHLNEKSGSAYKPVEANIRLITARLSESSLEECKAVIDAKVEEWKGDTVMEKYLRPETLFGATKFAQYVGQLGNSGGGPNPFV
jgi:uncharacterized phage protein (TIGR02220 family)